MALEYRSKIVASSQYGEVTKPAQLTGPGDTTGIVDIRRKIFIEPMIYEIGRPHNYLQWLCSRNAPMMVEQPQYAHMTWKPLERVISPNAGVLVGALIITVKTIEADRLRVNHVWMNESTGERFLITKIAVDATTATTTNVTVVRKFGSTAAAAMTTAHVLRRLGSAFAETDTPGLMQYVKEGHSPNSVQFFSATSSISEMAMAMSFEGQNHPWADLQRRARYEYEVDKESAFLRGEYVFDEEGATTKSAPTSWRGATRGLGEFINSSPTVNKITVASGASLGFDDLSDVLYEINRNRGSSGQKQINVSGKLKKHMNEYNLVALCGKKGRKTLSKIQRTGTTLNVDQGQSTYGYHLTQLKTDNGMIDVVTHLDMVGDLDGTIYLIDPTRLKCVKFKNHGTHVRDVTDPKVHGKSQEIYSIEGINFYNPECFGKITVE